MELRVDKEKDFLRYLRRYMDCGVKIYIDGEEAKNKDLLNMLKVSENGPLYMGDYIEDERKGVLKEIRFDKIRIPYKSLTAKKE